MTMICVHVPFQGFCDTLHDDAINGELASSLEYYEEESDQAGIDAVNNFNMTKKKMMSYADKYLSRLSHEIGQKIGMEFDFKNHEVNSPREYNFRNDMIFASVDSDVLEKIYQMTLAEHEQELSDMVREELEPRSGFIPFHSNVLNDWDNDIKEWEDVKIGFVLKCFLENLVNENWEQDIINDMNANGEVSEVIEA